MKRLWSVFLAGSSERITETFTSHADAAAWKWEQRVPAEWEVRRVVS